MSIPRHILPIRLAEFKLGCGVLLFNTLNQALVELTDTEFMCLIEDGSSAEQRSLQTALEPCGVLETPSLPLPRVESSRVVLVPTLLCNKNCPYCYHGGSVDLTMQKGDIPLLVSYVRDFLYAKKPPRVCVIWHGGEPLIALSLISKISTQLYSMATEMEYEESLLTNGLLLSPPTVDQLVRHTHINELQISIDRETSQHSLDMIQSAVRTLLAEKWAVTVKYNIQETDWTYANLVAEAFSSLVGKGRLSFILGYLEPHGPLGSTPCLSFPDFIDRYWSLSKRLRDLGIGWTPDLPEKLFSACVANDPNAITIGPDLYAYRCNVNIPMPEWRIANVRVGYGVEPCAEASAPFMKYDPTTDAKCCTCPALHCCMGGCHVKRIFGQRNLDYCEGTMRRLKWQIVEFYMSHEQDQQLPQVDLSI